jgi:hypothetical protein
MTGVGQLRLPAVPPEPAGAPASRHPATGLGRWRLTVVAISFAVAALPLLRPSGPGNTGLVDLALVGAMLVCVMWASARSYPVRLPYAIPVGLMVLAGALAVAMSGADTNTTWRGVVALAQDVFVLCWAAAVATMGQDRELLDTFCRAWAYSVTGWAVVLIVADILGIGWLSGVSEANGIRASLTLGDPNLAASYFLCGLLVIRAARRPRRAGLRWLACALVVTALVLTLSNGGILAMIVATVVGALFALWRRRGALPALGAAALLVIAIGALVTTVDVRDWVAQVEESSPLVRDSLGREAESSGSRSALVEESVRVWTRLDTLTGVGPGSTRTTLLEGQAPYVKEAHDDYLAALLERGVLGVAALGLLITAVAVRARRACGPAGLSPPFREVVPRPELLGAALVAVALSAVFYEVLHFRHVWALLGLVAALAQTGRRL